MDIANASSTTTAGPSTAVAGTDPDRRLGPPPGPRLPRAIQTLLLFRDPVRFLERCRRRYGPVFRIDFPGAPPLAYIAEPALARTLYAHDRQIGRAGDARRPYLSPLVGDHSLLCVEGEEWERQRRLLAPPLHGERITGWADRIAAIAAAEIDSWPDGEIELRPRMQAITLEVILRLVFGVTDAGRLDRLRRLLPALLEAVDSPFVFGLPKLRERLGRPPVRHLPGNPVRRFERVRDATDAVIFEELDRRRRDLGEAGIGERTDVLSMLIEARDPAGEPMSDTEIRDELMTLLTAGHETTATALAWTFERLVRHPEALGRLVADLDAGEGEQPYLDAVIKEVLRTRPVVFDTPRALSGPIELGGYEIPAGWWAAPAIPLVHSATSVFDAPDRFDPERWLGDETPIAGWIPFGGGQRRCLGSRLALLELQVVIAAVLERRELVPTSEPDEAQRVQHVTLAPGERARVRTIRRG